MTAPFIKILFYSKPCKRKDSVEYHLNQLFEGDNVVSLDICLCLGMAAAGACTGVGIIIASCFGGGPVTVDVSTARRSKTAGALNSALCACIERISAVDTGRGNNRGLIIVLNA